MVAVWQSLMALSGVVTAVSALGVLRYVRQARQDAALAVRLLIGEEDVEADDGVLHTVRHNDRVLRYHDLKPIEERDADGS